MPADPAGVGPADLGADPEAGFGGFGGFGSGGSFGGGGGFVPVVGFNWLRMEI